MALKIYNTISKTKEDFTPLKDGEVGFYQCGPTVYWTQHLGNMRAMVMADVIVRTLKYLDYSVNFVRNYTDVGHLTSDEDEGQDKLEKGAEREGLSPQEIAEKYIDIFNRDVEKLNTLSPTHKPKATETIPEIIEMVQILLDKDFAYKTDLAIYFNIAKAKDYTRLSGQKLEDNIEGAGTGEVIDPQKINQSDFALWFFKCGKHAKALQTWASPYGEGFPGWHIECSAMSKKFIGDTVDIHMGGVEHVSVHHTNEIAQSESANEKPFVNYWIHNEHLLVDGGKMSKSEGTSFVVSDVEEKDIDLIALRFFLLQAHYRSQQNFTWEALSASESGLEHLYEQIVALGEEKGSVNESFKDKFIEKISDDFNTPQALAVVSEVLKSNISNEDKLATLFSFDDVLGLNFVDARQKVALEIPFEELPRDIQEVTKERELSRVNKDYKKSDKLREELLKLNYLVKDTDQGQKIFKK